MKKILSLLLALTMILSLCACGVCKICEGKKTVSCYLCEGKGKRHKIDCFNCKGAGYTIEKCSKCNMTGSIKNPITWESFECPSCHGNLTIKKTCSYSGIVKCINCDGTGFEECYKCNK